MVGKPIDVFMEWLGAHPQGARVAVVYDVDRLLARAGILGRSAMTDPGGRQWQMAIFRGDDLAFRLRFRKANAQPPVLMVVTRSEGAEGPADISYLADLFSKNEGGTPLDLSLTAYFKRLCPKINFPASELRRHCDALLDEVDRVPDAAKKIIERYGRPDDWGRGEVAAMTLLARRPQLSLADLWPNEIEPVEFVAHALKLLIGRAELNEDRPLLQEVIGEAARPQVQEYLHWLSVPATELAAYLVLRRFADEVELQNPSTQLAGLSIFSPETPLAAMEPLAVKVAASLEQDARTWEAIDQLSQAFLTPRRLERVMELLPAANRQPEALADAVRRAKVAPVILKQHLNALLTSFLKAPAFSLKQWLSKLEDHPFLSRPVNDLSPGASECRALIEFMRLAGNVEERLLQTPPEFSHPEALLDWYVSARHHFLEMDVAQAYHHLESCEDEKLVRAGMEYLFGGEDDLNPSQTSLKGRVRARLNELDQALAEFVRRDPSGFARGPRGAISLLKEKLLGTVSQSTAGAADGRAWVLLFDGMRFDTWEAVVQPILAEHFTIESRPYFCVLPSYTGIARTSVFAGCLPDEWRNYKGSPTTDEAMLVARNLGLTQQEAKTKLRFVKEADTTKARNRLSSVEQDAPLVNVLIYPISDECHEFRNDLVGFNNQIRVNVVGDKAQGVRGILDDLLRRIRPADTVLITSDHGFIELFPRDVVEVKQGEVEESGRSPQDDVRHRYLKGFRPASVTDVVEVPGVKDSYQVTIGSQWFRREGAKNAPRYDHGGLSLSEMVIPGAVLRRVTEKEARVELVALPSVGIVVDEDAQYPFSFAVQNIGNVAVEFELRVQTNLDNELHQQKGKLAPQATQPVSLKLTAKYRQTAGQEPDPAGTLTAVTLRLRHTDLKGKWRDALDGVISIPVKVKPKKTRLDTDALSGLDDV